MTARSDTLTFRTGRKLGRTIYLGDAFIGIMDTVEMANDVVRSLNGDRALLLDHPPGIGDADIQRIFQERDEAREQLRKLRPVRKAHEAIDETEMHAAARTVLHEIASEMTGEFHDLREALSKVVAEAAVLRNTLQKIHEWAVGLEAASATDLELEISKYPLVPIEDARLTTAGADLLAGYKLALEALQAEENCVGGIKHPQVREHADLLRRAAIAAGRVLI